ncbi:MAG TPA: hypothetical protein VJ464_16475 [Blastocatellia bacterium]|nr:hypothetical protein [Blastocatellia bacterium]
MMNVDYEAQQTAQAQLDTGERLLWHGRPDPKRQILGGLAIMLFGIPWTAFALFWTGAASGLFWGEREIGWPSLFGLFGVPFVLVGIGMLLSPYWAYRRAQGTVYVISNRRAMIITGARARKVQSFAAPDIGLIERTERSNGKGDVMFATATMNRNIQRIGFTGITEARRVERLLLDTFKHAEADRPAEDSAGRGFSPF